MTELEDYLKKNSKEYDVVHITNFGWEALPVVKTHAKDFIHLPFDDIDHFQYKELIPPKYKDVEKMLEWSKGRENIICSCHAGISRSAACAYLIMALEQEAEVALDILEKYKHYPNRLIVYMGAKILNNPKIWDCFKEWQIKYGFLDPSNNGSWPNEELKTKMKL